jgi:hypothetical protein
MLEPSSYRISKEDSTCTEGLPEHQVGRTPWPHLGSTRKPAIINRNVHTRVASTHTMWLLCHVISKHPVWNLSVMGSQCLQGILPNSKSPVLGSMLRCFFDPRLPWSNTQKPWLIYKMGKNYSDCLLGLS